MEKFVYLFKEGNKDQRDLLGGKGANLAKMTNLGLPVPKGFIISTKACNDYYENNETLDETILEEIKANVKKLELDTGKTFGGENPLLLSVRSGASVSMPGMMDSILNLGLNDKTAEVLAKKTNRGFAYDSYRRFIMMYADVVKGVDKKYFEKYLSLAREKYNVDSDYLIPEEAIYKTAKDFKKIYEKFTHENFPEDPYKQLEEAVKSVFKSFYNTRAKYFRKINNIPDSIGTAVNVQEMVYGNLNENSLTGVMFSRNPSTGEKGLFGEYLVNSQGEDVVSGVRTPKSMDNLKEEKKEIYDQLEKYATMLEKHYKDMQDMEFTVEDNKLYILQTRNGKRTGAASLKIALDLIREGTITYKEAILRITEEDISSVLHERFLESELSNHTPLAKGLPSSPGASSGKIYFDAKEITKHQDEDTILVRLETSPEDVVAMKYAKGILTIRGGMTSHAAVVARGLGTPCISGCEDILLDEDEKTIKFKDGTLLKEGDYISLDADAGKIYKGILKKSKSEINNDLRVFLKILEKYEGTKVRANAENIVDAEVAFKYGASGIGLARTEHMFFDKTRIFNFRKMILADDLETRKKCLLDILPYQKEDFLGLFKASLDKPVVIRYLDPPLHEFLPKEENEIIKLADALNISIKDIKERIASLKEFNPMMGHRGSRLLITYPEIIVMQTEAVIGAAIQAKKSGLNPKPEIMIPLIGDEEEFKYIKNIVDVTAKALMKKENIDINYKVGTMIELPRACIRAKYIANVAEFFSFGTNDLTQMTYGFSRDDASKFLNDYYDKEIFNFDPFIKFDKDGVGKLVELAIKQAKRVRSDIELGVCGEQGGNLESIIYFANIGLDYVSTSPYRVPIAKLASAKAAILGKESKL